MTASKFLIAITVPEKKSFKKMFLRDLQESVVTSNTALYVL